jgi:CRP-like cAMP-binding protein
MVMPRDNLLIAQLNETEYERLAPFLELIELTAKQRLYQANESAAYIYFPVGAIIDVFCALEDGTSAGVSTLERSSCGPVEMLTNAHCTNNATVVVPGLCYRLPLARVKAEMAYNSTLIKQLLMVLSTTIGNLSVATVCVRHHMIENRCAMWLLRASDIHQRDQIQVTQSQIADILGVRREAVSTSLSRYEKQELISKAHGKITVLDRAGLQRWTCCCYWQLK